MAETFHLTSQEVWTSQAMHHWYRPEGFEREGFIHCTDGADNVIAVGNRYYQSDARPFVCLVIDVDRLSSPVNYEDVSRIYPHIYGPLNTDAVIRLRVVTRADDGTFLALGD